MGSIAIAWARKVNEFSRAFLRKARILGASETSKSSPNLLFISARHLVSKAAGQTMRIAFMGCRACSSFRIDSASMVLPRPTSSAIRKRCLSESRNLRTGLNCQCRNLVLELPME